MSGAPNPLSDKIFNATVLVTSLGYLVDMFDMFLYNMNRVKSLTDLGLSGDSLTSAGLLISNFQMGGFLVGAYLWGVLADKIGRKKGLFASILLYSIGSLYSAFVHSVDSYAIARFLSGMGLAGELGAGIALLTEKLDARHRGIGVMIFISSGYLGVVLAGMCTELLPWRTAYILGGIGGLALFLTRMFLGESEMFSTLPTENKIRGGLIHIFRRLDYFKYYLGGILLLTPAVFIPQLVWTLSPEIGKAMHIMDVKASIVTAAGFGCAIIGDLLAAGLSEILRSRKQATVTFLIMAAAIFFSFLVWPPQSLTTFYIYNGVLGLMQGCWVVTCGWAAEHFGTNIRATVATTTPNFARGLTIPMNLAFVALKPLGILSAIGMIGAVVFGLALLGWCGLRETYGRDLNYVE